MRKTCLITGASAGIGEQFAKSYAKRDHNLVLVARREDRLSTLGSQLQETYNIEYLTVAADLHDREAPAQIAKAIKEKNWQVDILVNNAGYGLPGMWSNTSWRDQNQYLQLMLTSYLHLIHLYWPSMIESGYGRVINVASLAGVMPSSAGHSLYGPIKSFLIKFSESLYSEAHLLDKKDVRTLALCPGFTYTEFHDVNKTRNQVSKMPKFMWRSSEKVVEEAISAIEKGKSPRLINGLVNQAIATVSQSLPYMTSLKLFSLGARGHRRTEGQ